MRGYGLVVSRLHLDIGLVPRDVRTRQKSTWQNRMRDADVRVAVLERLQSLHVGDASTRIVQEMNLWSGAVRIDIAVINGELSGYELKSARDTLTRLPLQADIYSRIFDYVTLVAADRHLENAAAKVPNWWGIMQADEFNGRVSLSCVRPALLNPNPEPYLLAELLRKEEALAILQSHGLDKGWRSRRVRDLHERLASELSFRDLSEGVRRSLKERSEWLSRQ